MEKDFIRLEVLRFPLIMLVVYIHAAGSSINVGNSTVGLAALPSPYLEIQYLITKVARLAVPLFFLGSGFLFFREGKMSSSLFKTKLLSRVRTLLVPFLIWNTALFTVVFIAQQIPQFAAFFNAANTQIKDMSNLERLDAIFGVTRFPIAYQFWFIRDLIILVLVSPVIYIALRVAGPIVLLGLLFLWTTRFWPLPLPDVESVLFFALGAYCGIKQRSLFDLDAWGRTICICFALLLLASLAFRSGVSAQITNAAVILLGMLAALYVSKWLISKDAIERAFLFLGGTSFFVFAIHEPLMTILKKIMFRYVEMTPGLSFATYLLSPVIVIVISIALFLLLAKTFPKGLAVMTGGRAASLRPAKQPESKLVGNPDPTR